MSLRARPCTRGPLAAGVTVLLWTLASPALALRDPTQPPAEPARAASRTGAAGAALPDLPLAVIVRDGRAYVVVGTRLYAQGDRIGGAVIERIGESEIWLREGKTLHKIPRFGGIQRRPAS